MKTPIAYYGGKQKMLKYIRPLVPDHTLYCEPFAGGAALFFDKEPASVNVINDLNAELITFYRVVALRPAEFCEEISRTLHSRQQYEQAWHIYNHSSFFTDVQRAWAVWVLSKLGFGGKLAATFGFDKKIGRKNRSVQIAKSFIVDDGLKSLLENATIECDDAFTVIRRYDCPQAFHFIDPPYVGCNMGHYAGMFNEQNLEDLLALCATLQGKFMLTMFPHERIRQYVEQHGWHIHSLNRTILACRVKHRRVQEEWIVVNYTV
jgi:DNA adenine methylase